MDSTVGRTAPLNALLRGELAAVEAYEQALARVGDRTDAAEVRRLADDHRTAVTTLRDHVVGHQGAPATGSGLWGLWARAVEGAAGLLGGTPALWALREGEEHGIRSYRSALRDEKLPADCKTLIRDTLLPRTREHLPVLDRLMRARPARRFPA